LICDLNKSQVSASYHKLLLKSYSNIFFLISTNDRLCTSITKIVII